MSLSNIFDWLIQGNLWKGVRGRAKEGSLLHGVRKSLSRLGEYKNFVAEVSQDIDVLNKVMKLLKTEGISQDTIKQAKEILKTISRDNSIRIGMREILTK